jgi:putative transposase
MDLIAGRTAQEYNRRKKRRGAFWEDRYHATAIEGGDHLIRCMVYIDLNMVRAGKVMHPSEWPFCGYNEILGDRQRYEIIHWPSLMLLLGMNDREKLKRFYKEWVEDTLRTRNLTRDDRWTESLAVGSKEFVERTAFSLGIESICRKTKRVMKKSENGETGTWILREKRGLYNRNFARKNGSLRKKNGALSGGSCEY